MMERGIAAIDEIANRFGLSVPLSHEFKVAIFRALLKVLAEPNEAMIEAGWEAMHDSGKNDEVPAIFTAMITSASGMS